MCRRSGGTKGAQKEQGIMIVSMGKEMKIINWEKGSFVHHRIVTAVKRVEFVNDSCHIQGVSRL